MFGLVPAPLSGSGAHTIAAIAGMCGVGVCDVEGFNLNENGDKMDLSAPTGGCGQSHAYQEDDGVVGATN